jgi:esterase/lipase
LNNCRQLTVDIDEDTDGMYISTKSKYLHLEDLSEKSLIFKQSVNTMCTKGIVIHEQLGILQSQKSNIIESSLANAIFNEETLKRKYLLVLEIAKKQHLLLFNINKDVDKLRMDTETLQLKLNDALNYKKYIDEIEHC